MDASRVSILVFLELAPGRRRVGLFPDYREVSILVFLELAPGRNRRGWRYTGGSGFNPCFSGTRARTLCPEYFAIQNIMFQSLFFWNSRPDPYRRSIIRRHKAVSILVFLELAPGLHTTRETPKSGYVSILVFLELAPGPRLPDDLSHIGRVSILVFLELAPGLRAAIIPAARGGVSILVFLELAPGL